MYEDFRCGGGVALSLSGMVSFKVFYCLFFISLYFCFRFCLLYIFDCMYFLSLDATILVNKDVHKGSGVWGRVKPLPRKFLSSFV